jgi:formylglycine-generating enzyme required for sulfatase activity
MPPGHDRNQGVKEGLSWENPFTTPHVPDDRDPVVEVTHAIALEHARWLGVALPTEAQWERAAGWDPATKTARRFAWGDALPTDRSGPLANLIDVSFMALFPNAPPVLPGYDDGYGLVAPVGSFPKDCSPAGALDMTGNVRELCLDAWDPGFYAHSPRQDPLCEVPGESASLHSTRGGSWGFHTATVSVHERSRIGYPSNVIGYRFAVR